MFIKNGNKYKEISQLLAIIWENSFLSSLKSSQ